MEEYSNLILTLSITFSSFALLEAILIKVAGSLSFANDKTLSQLYNKLQITVTALKRRQQQRKHLRHKQPFFSF